MTQSKTNKQRSFGEKALVVALVAFALLKGVDFLFYGYALYDLGTGIGLGLMAVGTFSRGMPKEEESRSRRLLAERMISVGAIVAVASYLAKYYPW